MLEVPETGGLLKIGKILPLADGSVVIGGQVQYPGERRRPHKTDYQDPQDMVRNDAIAMRLDASGALLWTIRLGDPQADNHFSPLGLLPDGRILLSFWAEDSSFGDRLFIVGLDGVVEEMLPWRTMAAHFPPRSMMFMPQSGYLGGDSTVVDFYYDYHTGPLGRRYHTESQEMALLDFDLSEVWRFDLLPLDSIVNDYLAAQVSDGIVLLGMTWESACTSLVKLDGLTGEVLWQLTDEPRGNRSLSHGAYGLAETPEGELLFTGAFLEPGRTLDGGEPFVTLTKITADGAHVWTKRYEDMDLLLLYNIVPFKNGYVMRGIRQSSWNSFLFLYVDADGELLGTLAIGEEADRTSVWPLLAAAPDGTVYIAGSIETVYDREKATRGELMGSYLGILEVEHFSIPTN